MLAAVDRLGEFVVAVVPVLLQVHLDHAVVVELHCIHLHTLQARQSCALPRHSSVRDLTN
jgi:hypothetical protein